MASSAYDEMRRDVLDHVGEFGRLVSGGRLQVEEDEAAKELAAITAAIIDRVLQYARKHERAH
jgi:hypothetical protein